MTVRELIKKLESMPQDVHVYAEGEPADKVIFEKSPNGTDGIVRIFKAWDVEFVGRGIEPKKSEKIDCKATKCENCQNHNYCDYESQKSEDKEYAECIDAFKEWALGRKRGDKCLA